MEKILIAEALNRLLSESAIEKLSRISFATAKTKPEILDELINKKYDYLFGQNNNKNNPKTL